MSSIASPVPVVIDASVAVELVLGSDPALEQAWARWLEGSRLIVAPDQLWPETANALLTGRRIDGELVIGRLGRLRDAGVDTVRVGPESLDRAVRLATRHRLSVYDALYLELALDVDGSLATFDRALVRAAGTERVALERIASA